MSPKPTEFESEAILLALKDRRRGGAGPGQKKRPRHTVITKEQDQLFFRHPECMTYFMRLLQAGETPEEIATQKGCLSRPPNAISLPWIAWACSSDKVDWKSYSK